MTEERVQELEAALVAKDLELNKYKETLKAQVDEVARCAKSAAELLGHLMTRQQDISALQERLRKVIAAFEAANNLIIALDTKDPERSATMRTAYSKALIELQTDDNAPSTQEGGPAQR